MRMRKKSVCAFILLLCLALAWRTAQAAAKPIVSGAERLRYAVGDQLLWTVTEAGQVSYYDSKMIRTDVAVIQGAARLAADNQTLYCQANDGGQQLIYACTPSETSPYGRVLEADFTVRQLEAAGSLYLLGDDGCVYTAMGRGIRGPYYAEKLTAQGWENEKITAIAAYGQYFCAYSGQTGRLSVMQRSAEGVSTLTYPSVTVEGLTYIQVGQVAEGEVHLYALRDPRQTAGLLDINARTGQVQQAEISVPEGSMGLRRSADTLYTLSADGTALYAVKLSVQAGKKADKLTLLNTFINLKQPSGYEAAAFARFYERYPDVQLAERLENEVRVIATDIMAGAEGCDITTIQENSTFISSIDMYRAGAAVNLEEIPEIADTLARCADVFAPMSAEGHLIGIPHFYQPYIWSLNETLATELGVEIPRDGWTWADFFALGETVHQYNASHGTQLYLLQDQMGTLPYFLVQYNANTVDALRGTASYNDAGFIDDLTRWTQLCRDRLVLFREQETMNSRALLYAGGAGYSSAVEGEYGPLLLPPVFDGQTRYPADVVRTVLNANSPCREAAEYLLACLFTEDALRSTAFRTNNGYLLKTDMENDLKNDPSGNKRVWYAMLQNAVQDYYIGDLYKDQWQHLYPQLLEGKMSPQEYAQTCQMRAEMVLSE